jgi:hypothetical protein
MQTLPTASPEEQEIVVKAAEARYAELGVTIETAAILFQNEIAKTAQEMFGQLEKEGQIVQPFVQGASTAGSTLQDFWSALPPMVRSGLINALIGGGVGALGGAGYGALQGMDPMQMAGQGAGYGALAGAATPLLSNLIQKFSEDLDGTFEALTKAAVDNMVEQGFTEKEAEQLVLLHLQKVAAYLGAYHSKMDDKVKTAPRPVPPKDKGVVKPPKVMPRTGKEKKPETMPKKGCDADKGDYHANPAGAYPLQVFSDIKKKVKKTQKQRKIKKIAATLTEAVKESMCGSSHGKPAAKKSKNKKPKAKAKKE